MNRNNNNNNRNNNNQRNNKKPQFKLLPVSLPSPSTVDNGKEIFNQLLKKIDFRLITLDNTKPSDTIKNTFSKLNPFQQYMLYAKITEKDIEKLKDVADISISKNDDERLKNLLKLSEETEPVELTGRVFRTIDQLIIEQPNNNWLNGFKQKLFSSPDLLLKLAIKMANYSPVESKDFISSLDYYFLQNKLEVLK